MVTTFVVMGHNPWLGNFFYSGNCLCVYGDSVTARQHNTNSDS